MGEIDPIEEESEEEEEEMVKKESLFDSPSYVEPYEQNSISAD